MKTKRPYNSSYTQSDRIVLQSREREETENTEMRT